MPRRLRNALGWVAATAAAVAIAHAGVSTVAGRVVDPLPPAVGLADAAASEESTAAPSATATTGPGGPSDPGSEPAPSSTATRTSADDPPAATATPAPTSTPTPGPTSSPRATPTPTPTPTPSPSSAPAEVRSYALVGGTATLRYEAGRVTVVSAEPAQGFTLDVEGDGSDEVTVEFESDDHRSRLRGEWEDGAPRDRVDEDGRSDDDESEDD